MRNINEKDVLKSCKQMLTYYQALGRLDYFRITTTGRPTRDGRFFKNPDQAGFPDIFIWLDTGVDLYIEVKRPGGKLSPSQKVFRDRSEKFGKKYYLIEAAAQLQRIVELNLNERSY